MATLASLAINLIAQTNRFTRPLAEATRHVDRFASKAENSLKRVEQAGKKAGLSLVALQGSIMIATKLAADYAGSINAVAGQTGLLIDTVQKLSYAVSQSDSDFGTLQVGLRAFVRRAAEARDGNASFAKGFDKLGVSVTDAHGNLRDIETMLMEVADSVASMRTEAEASAALMAVMGEAGRKLVPFMRQGSAGIRELMDEAERLGLVLDDKSIRQLAAFGDQTARTQNRIGALSREMAVEFIPVLDLIDRFVNRVIDGFMGLDDEARANAAMLATMTAAVLGLVMGLGMIAVGVGLAAKTLTFFGTIVAFAFSPLFLQLAAVGIFVTLAITQFDRLVEWWRGTEWGQIVAEAWEQIRETWQRDDLTLGQKVLSTVSIVVESVVGLVESITRWWVNTSVLLAEKTVALVGLDPDENALVGFLRSLQDIWNDSELTFGEKVIETVGVVVRLGQLLWEWLGERSRDLWSLIQDLWDRNVTQATAQVDAAGEIEVRGFSAVVVNTVRAVWGTLTGWWSSLSDWWSSYTVEVGDGGEKLVSGFKVSLINAVTTLWGTLSRWWATLGEWWNGYTVTAEGGEEKRVAGFKAVLVHAIESVWGTIQGWWWSLSDWWSGYTVEAGDGEVKQVEGFRVRLINAVEAFWGTVSSWWASLSGWWNGYTVEVGDGETKEVEGFKIKLINAIEIVWDWLGERWNHIKDVATSFFEQENVVGAIQEAWDSEIRKGITLGIAVLWGLQHIPSLIPRIASLAGLTPTAAVSGARWALHLGAIAVGASVLWDFAPPNVKEFITSLLGEFGRSIREAFETGELPEIDFSNVAFAEDVQEALRGFGDTLGSALGKLISGAADAAGYGAGVAAGALALAKQTADFFIGPFIEGFWEGLRENFSDRIPQVIQDAFDYAMENLSPTVLVLTVGLSILWSIKTIASIFSALVSALVGRGLVQATGASAAGTAAQRGIAARLGTAAGLRLRQLIPLTVGLAIAWSLVPQDLREKIEGWLKGAQETLGLSNLTVGLAVYWTVSRAASILSAVTAFLVGRGIVQAGGAAGAGGAASKLGAATGFRLRGLLPFAIGLSIAWDILHGDNLLGNLLRDVKSFLGVEPGSTGDWFIDIGTTVALGVAINWSIKAAGSLASGLIGAIAAASGGVLVATGLGLAFAIPIYMALEPTLSMEPMEDTIWHLTPEERKALFASGPEYAPPAPGSGPTIGSTEDLAEFFGVDPSVLEQFDTDHLFAPGGIFSGDLIYPEFFAVQEAAEEAASSIAVMLDVLEDYSDLAQRLEREGIDLENFMLVLGEMESGWRNVTNSASSAMGEFQLLASTREALELELGDIDWEDPAERMRASFEWLRMGVENEFATIAAAAERLGIQLEEALHLWWVVGGPALGAMQSLDEIATMGVTAGELLSRRRSIPSFAEGGWTGDMPADQFAGFVHGREIVIPERAHRKGLAGILEFLGVPGYKDGLTQRIPNLDADTATGITGVEGFLNSIAGQMASLVEMMDAGVESLLTLLETTLLESARGILPEDQFAALEERTLSLTRTVRDGWQQFKDLFHGTSDLEEAFRDLQKVTEESEKIAEQQAAIATLQGRILARLPVIAAAMDGIAAGAAFGPTGSVIGALIAVAMESETLAQIFRMLNEILSVGANALGMLLEPLLPLIYVLQAVLVPVFSVLGQVLEHMLLPIMPFIFEAFKWLGVAVLFVAEVFQTARAFILSAVGGLVEGIGRFIDSLPFFSAKTMIQAGINMQKSAEQAAKSAKELGAARRDLIDLTYEEAMARAKHTEELERATQALINVPIGMRTLNRLRWESATPRADVGIAAPPGLQVSAATAPIGGGGGGDMVFTGPITVVSNDPEDFERQLRQYRRRENLIETGTTAAMRRV